MYYESAEKAIIIALIAVAGAGLVFSLVSASAQSKCLDAGWREAKVDYRLHSYCVKRIDQTDVVVPIESVTK